jgi:AbrB family looped-hinge helix DNA binding protein
MKTTIDKAGRVVIPAAIRERAGVRPGTELEVTLDDEGIRLRRAVPPPRLVEVRGRWVARPAIAAEELTPLDIGALIAEERSRWP